MPSEVYLSLGSNLGSREAYIDQALTELQRKEVIITQLSSLYETDPVDVLDQPDFLNLVCKVKTAHDPLTLLGICQEIESAMYRIKEKPKGPRNIDIDLILYDQLVVNKAQLTIPHPRWHHRNFVLIPLLEIAPHLHDPVTNQTLLELLSKSHDRAQVTLITRPQMIGDNKKRD